MLVVHSDCKRGDLNRNSEAGHVTDKLLCLICWKLFWKSQVGGKDLQTFVIHTDIATEEVTKLTANMRCQRQLRMSNHFAFALKYFSGY